MIRRPNRILHNVAKSTSDLCKSKYNLNSLSIEEASNTYIKTIYNAFIHILFPAKVQQEQGSTATILNIMFKIQKLESWGPHHGWGLPKAPTNIEKVTPIKSR